MAYNKSIKKSFEVLNINCGGCATTVIDKLKARFPDIAVQLDHDPRIVNATITNEQNETYLIESLQKMGYPLKTAELDALTKKFLGTKSYVSCMQGKIAAKKHHQIADVE